MKVSELRIGNYITYESRADTDEVMEVVAGSLYRINESDGDGYSPIPLTEEWLLKFGFEERIEYEDFVIKIPSDHNDAERSFYIQLNGLSGLNYKDDSIDTESFHLNTIIKSVHQLQNLYFALTGEELTT